MADGKADVAGRPVASNAFVDNAHKLIQYLSIDIPVLGPDHVMVMRDAVNIGKGATLAMSLLLLLTIGNTNHFAGWLYVILHGSYAVIWVSKDYIFPDPAWQVRQTKGAFAMTILVLAGYWIAPYSLNSSRFEASNLRMTISAFMYILGVTLMTVADAQKFYTLRARSGLITDGCFKYTRNPNYVGEMLLYSAFALLSGSWGAWLYLFAIWGVVFYPRMVKKDISLSRYPEWTRYSQQSRMLLPNFEGWLRDLTMPAPDRSATASATRAQ